MKADADVERLCSALEKLLRERPEPGELPAHSQKTHALVAPLARLGENPDIRRRYRDRVGGLLQLWQEQMNDRQGAIEACRAEMTRLGRNRQHLGVLAASHQAKPAISHRLFSRA